MSREAPRRADPGRAVTHAFIPNSWGKPICDAKVDGGGRARTCNEPPGAEVHQVKKAKKRGPGAAAR